MTTKRISTKLLGDAGEHYALSQFSFAGNYAAKMPDNWEGYDLAVETGAGLVRVSVKTRSESVGWKSSRWFNWDDRKDCDWFVFIFKLTQPILVAYEDNWSMNTDIPVKDAASKTIQESLSC